MAEAEAVAAATQIMGSVLNGREILALQCNENDNDAIVGLVWRIVSADPLLTSAFHVAEEQEVAPLLRAARAAGMTVSGVAFHVGTGVSRVGVYDDAIAAARKVFDAAATLGMPPMRVLDIGGGFTAGTASAFQDACDVINAALQRHFGDMIGAGLEVIGEPGRYFAETTFSLAARVFGKRTRGEVREYWIDDGFYGTLCCVHLENYVPRPVPCY